MATTRFDCSIFIALLVWVSCGGAEPLEKPRSSALFIFGDSTVDPGNNNYINTIPENRADYPPYGQNSFGGGPTGRFSNGRVLVDFIAEYANLPVIPPFLQPSVEYINGVNFASGGAGILPDTNKGMVIDVPTQLRHFEAVQESLAQELGDEEASKLISEAVYFISIGSNDYLGGYLGNPKMRESHKPEAYIGMVVGNLTQAIQVLYGKGARKFGFLSLSPLGCLPALRAREGGCFEEANALALAHNNAFKSVLGSIQHLFDGFKYCNSNFYDWLLDRMNNPKDHNFKEGKSACCGTGPYRGIFTCGGTKKVREYESCDNADEYVWWDSMHPTERIHEDLAKGLWDGPLVYAGPYKLEALFFDRDELTIADIVDDPGKGDGF